MVRQRLVYLLARLLRVSTPMVWITPDNVAAQLKVVEAKWQEALRIATAQAYLAGFTQGQRDFIADLRRATAEQGHTLSPEELEVLQRHEVLH